MRHFLRLCELAKVCLSPKDQQEFFSYAEKAQIFVFPSFLFSSSFDANDHLQILDDFDICCQNCKRKKLAELEDYIKKLNKLVKEDNILLNKLDDDDNIKFDAPFPVMSLELMQGDILYANCILAAETCPNTWKYWWLYKDKNGRESVIIVLSDDKLRGKVFAALVDRINRQHIGTVPIRQRVKIGTGKDKKIVTIRQLTYVFPKHASRPKYSPSGREIDWSHRWFVRGHWREVKGMGKNRDGVYCIQGWTWVVEHIKGDENKPLIKKVHILKQVMR